MSIYEDFQPISFDEIKTYKLASRPSKVTVRDFAEPIKAVDSLKTFLNKLPDILAVQSLREIAKQIRRAKELNKPIVFGIGGHIVKTGLAPIIIDLMKRGFVSAIASNGSVLVHDTEIALVGFTSEDVDASLGKGDFGAAEETGEILNSAAKRVPCPSLRPNRFRHSYLFSRRRLKSRPFPEPRQNRLCLNSCQRLRK